MIFTNNFSINNIIDNKNKNNVINIKDLKNNNNSNSNISNNNKIRNMIKIFDRNNDNNTNKKSNNNDNNIISRIIVSNN